MGTPVDTAAADSVGVGGNGLGQGAVGLAGRAGIQLPSGLFIDDDGGVDHLAHPVSFPFGQVPVHGNGNRADLPTPQRGQHEVLRIRDSKCDKGTRLRTAGGQRPPPLVGAGVEFAEGQATGRCRRGRRRSPPVVSAALRASSCSLVPNGIPSSSGLGVAPAVADSVLMGAAPPHRSALHRRRRAHASISAR